MCGIVGYATVVPDPALGAGFLNAACDALRERGPDGEGIWTAEGVGLGHRRLSIIDVAGGAQPMSYGDGRYWITYNGELYNYREIRHDLVARGHHFRTASDTEVILAAYAEWGPRPRPPSAASSPSRSGMHATAGSSSPATTWASSRSSTTTGPTAASSSRPGCGRSWKPTACHGRRIAPASPTTSRSATSWAGAPWCGASLACRRDPGSAGRTGGSWSGASGSPRSLRARDARRAPSPSWSRSTRPFWPRPWHAKWSATCRSARS